LADPAVAQPDHYYLHTVDLAVAAAPFLLMNGRSKSHSKHSAPPCGARRISC
jgi:hypothetical protein